MSGPDVSVVTACLPTASDHLREAAESVGAVRARGVDVEWILVLDGPETVTPPEAASVVLTLPRRRGVAAARNYGLSAARAPFLACLDADDELVAEGVLAGLQRLRTDDTVGWVAANRILTTGERTIHWHGARAWAPGEVASEWSTPMAFHANTLVVRRALVEALGGWAGLGACEDLMLSLRLGEVSAGASIPEVLIRYRAWEGQTTRHPSFRDEQLLAYRFIEACLNSERAERGRPPVTHPEPRGGWGAEPA